MELFKRYVKGVTQSCTHFFITEAGISSYPGAELFIERITEIVYSSDTSGIIILLILLSIYNKGFTLECILLASVLPTEI